VARYVEPKELLAEIIASKEKGELSPRALEILMKMTHEISRMLKYRHIEDKEDCISFALEDLLKYWDRFDPARSTNAFAFYTQVIKNGLAKGWGKLHPIKPSKKVSISQENGIYNI
jgi:DNA-directed RNA polymerase specialized sigma subunit